jgi:hypothetical protein
VQHDNFAVELTDVVFRADYILNDQLLALQGTISMTNVEVTECYMHRSTGMNFY